MNNLFLAIIGLTLFVLFSCSEKKSENRFININKANTEILNLSGIDILKFKSQIEKDFEIDDTFYDSIIYHSSVNNTNVIFEKYGYYSIKTSGDTITGNDRDSLLYKLGKGFAFGIIQEDCKNSNEDSLCIVKMDYYKSLSNIELPIGRVENTMSDFIYYKLYKKGYLNKEEFVYMTLWWYILSSIQAISDMEWQEKRKQKHDTPNTL